MPGIPVSMEPPAVAVSVYPGDLPLDLGGRIDRDWRLRQSKRSVGDKDMRSVPPGTEQGEFAFDPDLRLDIGDSVCTKHRDDERELRRLISVVAVKLDEFRVHHASFCESLLVTGTS
jgi:hypothetical protein